MEWLSCIRKTVEMIENDLKTDVSADKIAIEVGISTFFLQKGFSVMTGYSIREYARNRKLYQAALDLQTSDEKIIDIALNYGYETPESFTKAFTRFHGCTPSQVRAGASIKSFLPLKINIQIFGGDQMNVKIVKMESFQVMGYQKVFSNQENAEEKIPQFWDEVFQIQTVKENPGLGIGEFGICIDEAGEDTFRYFVAGRYTGGEVPAEMELLELPGGDYAVFDCYGPIPETIHKMNTQAFQQWLPGNPNYELRGNASVEWYDCNDEDMALDSYHSAVWLPVKKI